jgi:riboflavin biosynthesis pyrimidine reductase
VGLVKRGAPAATPDATLRVLGIDDWAWQKGQHHFGTILVDLERRRVVDVLLCAPPMRSRLGSRLIPVSRSSAATATDRTPTRTPLGTPGHVDPSALHSTYRKGDEMRKLILRMAITLDGVVAPENAQDVFNFTDEEVWSDTLGMIETVDTMLIGAGMHQEYLSHWRTALSSPTASESERRYATIAARTPHLVLSRTLRAIEWPNVTVLTDGVDGIADLKKQAVRDIILWGGATAAAAAIEAGVVDEYHLVTHPAIAGGGKKLFDKVLTMRRVRHQGTKTFASGIVVLKYARA